MSLQLQFPPNSTVLNGDHLAKVIGYSDNDLVLEGIGEFAHIGKWLANPKITTRLSNGHFGLVDGKEYFFRNDILYRAPLTNAMDISTGNRLGAREVLPKRLLTPDYLELLGLSCNL